MKLVVNFDLPYELPQGPRGPKVAVRGRYSDTASCRNRHTRTDGFPRAPSQHTPPFASNHTQLRRTRRKMAQHFAITLHPLAPENPEEVRLVARERR